MKSETPKPATTNPEAAIRILKIATCASVSGKSKLTYHVGSGADSEIHFRIFENSAAGAFSQAWISLDAIREAVSKNDKAITSFFFFPLYRGTSINTQSFLLAALKNEGLVQPSTTKRRCHEWVSEADEARFVAEMQAWAASGREAKVEDKPTKVRAKSAKGSGQVHAAEVKADDPPKVMAKVKPAKRSKEKIAKSSDAK